MLQLNSDILYCTVHQGGVWNFFLIGQNRASNQRSGMILEVQIRSFGARAHGARRCMRVKVFIFKNSRGLKYQYFFVKIGMKLPLTIKNKRRNTNLKFEFQNYFIFTPEKACFQFLKKNTTTKNLSSSFGSDSALKTINARLFFVRYFSKCTTKKIINPQI